LPDVELILALMVAVAVIATAPRAVRVPYPILLGLGGLVLALTPAVPDVQLCIATLQTSPLAAYCSSFANGRGYWLADSV
jgi:NhaP-type Na+/H+ or K+/H+ antiporter